jgi:zinc protease
MIAQKIALAGLLCLTAAPARFAPADSGPVMFDVGTLHVILERRAETPIVVAQLYLLGGARQISAANAGIEPLVLRASQYGSAAYPGGAARLALARTASRVSFEATDDFSVATLTTMRPELDSAWAVFANEIVSPTLGSPAIESVRRRMLISRLGQEGDPDGVLREMVRRVGYQGHPYANDPNGTDVSLRAITTQAANAYHAAQFVTSRMLLVIVGDVDRSAVERLVNASLVKLPAGAYAWTLPPPIPRRATSMTIIPRKLDSDYIIGVFPGPTSDAKDYGSFRMATELLGSRLNYAIRDQMHLAYVATSQTLDDAASAGAVYVTTTSPEDVMDLILKQIESVANQGLPRSAMPWFVSQFSIERLTESETAQGEAAALARAFLFFGNYRAVDAPIRAMNDVSETTLMDAASHYIPAIRFVFVGDTSRFRRFMR